MQPHMAGFILTFVLAVILVPLVRKLCFKKGLVDVPNNRKIHTKPIPRLGGVAIWISSIAALLWFINTTDFIDVSHGFWGIVAGGSLMFLLGIVDDIKNLSARTKLYAQIGITIVAFLLGVRIEALYNPINAQVVSLEIWSFPFTMLWLVGITNAVNFIDGVDGLAGGITTISAVTLGMVAFYTGQPDSAFIAALLAGSTMGFLVYNFYPAKIFMGDSGSLFSGFLLAALSVTGVLKTVTVTILMPILILAVPILDISYSTFRRLYKGRNPFMADSEHIHHKLLKAGFSQNQTVITLYTLCIGAGSIAIIDKGIYEYRAYAVLVVTILSIMLVLARISTWKKFIKKLYTMKIKY